MNWIEWLKIGLIVLNGLIIPVVGFQVSLWIRQSRIEQKQALTDQRLTFLPDVKTYNDLLEAVRKVEQAVVENRAETAANFKNLDKELSRVYETLGRHEDYNKPRG